MRIAFKKISDERHVLEIRRDDGRRESVECETRSLLLHDLLHWAVESEAGLEGGFWGRLAGGATLAYMNDRTKPPDDQSAELAAIEQLVGALHGAAKGRSPAEMIAGMRGFAEALGATLPDWLTEALVESAQDRLRRALGKWRATPYGEWMELDWRAQPA